MPKLAISCIAWENFENLELIGILKKYLVKNIEAAPALFLESFENVSDTQAIAVKKLWNDNGFEFCAMQALLFGHPEFSLFGKDSDRDVLRSYLKEIFRVAQIIGAKNLVFGSPKNRLKTNLSDEQAFGIATEFFKEVARDAYGYDCVLCMEPNANDYGCDFITHHEQAMNLVAAVDNAGFGLQIDCGVMLMNDEKPQDLMEDLRRYKLMPSHVHLSAPFLAPLSDDYFSFYDDITKKLIAYGYDGNFSIEMRKSPAHENMAVIESVLTLMRKLEVLHA